MIRHSEQTSDATGSIQPFSKQDEQRGQYKPITCKKTLYYFHLPSNGILPCVASIIIVLSTEDVHQLSEQRSYTWT